jgi:hypothetical protein
MISILDSNLVNPLINYNTFKNSAIIDKEWPGVSKSPRKEDNVNDPNNLSLCSSTSINQDGIKIMFHYKLCFIM